VPKIFELDPHVADLIAAGEVVERPASVVKELMENSIDAGAGLITVEIAAGGMTFIRVSDNGCGIAPEDVQTAFLRHATSKLRDAGGLEAIATLGFRGEALAAIAAVSRIELLTCEPGAGEGVSLMLEAGEVVDISPAGCPEGTTIIVRDLFFNTPARLKFMKTDRAESSAVASAVLRCALAHPEASVRFIRDGRTEYQTPGDSRVDSCIYSLLGREFSAGLVGAESSDDNIAVTGFISTPAAARGNRSYQFFFVNGRPIRSITLQAALEQAYANRLTSGRFPSCVLYISSKPGDVDVNVHPAKTEVKFVSDKQVFDGVYYAALGALDKVQSAMQGEDEHRADGHRADEHRADEHRIIGQTIGRIPEKPGKSGFKSMQVDEYRSKYIQDIQGGQSRRALSGDAKIQPPHEASVGSPMYDSLREASAGSPMYDSLREAPAGSPTLDTSPATSANSLTLDTHFGQSAFRVIGEALNVYIIVEYRNAVWFIDKHAAHERIHFDALRRGGYKPMSQALITPVVCRLGFEDASILLENTEMLEGLGFTIESFGDDSVAVRNIPADIDIGEAEPVLSEICGELRRGEASDTARLDAIYQMIACKAAIKAGKASGMRELETLAARVISGEVSHCPHGRPVAFEITKSALDKSFKRI